MRTVATEMRMSVAGLAKQVSRDALLEMSALEHGMDLVDRIAERPPERQVAAFIPVECRAEPGFETTDPAWDRYEFATFRPFGVRQMRVWLTWCNLAQTHPGVADAVEQARQRQLWVLHGLGARGGTADRTLALVDGLRAATCRRVDPMPLEDARETLACWCERTFAHTTG